MDYGDDAVYVLRAREGRAEIATFATARDEVPGSYGVDMQRAVGVDLAGHSPVGLRPGQFVTLLLLLACGLFVGLKQYAEVTVSEAAWCSIGIFFVLRVLTVRFNWTTRSVLPESLNSLPPK